MKRLKRIRFRWRRSLGGQSPIILYAISLVGALCFVALITVLVTLRTQEQTTVPDLVGDEVAVALLKLQERNLIPKVRLQHDNDPLTEGTIIDQSPGAGSQRARRKGYQYNNQPRPNAVCYGFIHRPNHRAGKPIY